jgi:hypothetical protein
MDVCDDGIGERIAGRECPPDEVGAIGAELSDQARPRPPGMGPCLV